MEYFMISYIRKSQRHYIRKDANSFSELSQAFRKRRKTEYFKFIHIVTTVVFLMVAFRFGTLFSFIFYSSTSATNFALQIKLPYANSAKEYSTNKMLANTYSKNVYITLNTRGDVVIDNFRVRNLNMITKTIRRKLKTQRIKYIMIGADKNSKMGLLIDILHYLKPFAKTESNPKGIPIVLVTRDKSVRVVRNTN